LRGVQVGEKAWGSSRIRPAWGTPAYTGKPQILRDAPCCSSQRTAACRAVGVRYEFNSCLRPRDMGQQPI